MSLNNFPLLIKWRKNEFKKFLSGTIFKTKKRDKCRWRVPVRYYMYLNFVSIGELVWKVLGGDQNLPQTHTHTRTHTYTHTHTPAAHLISLNKKTRLQRY